MKKYFVIALILLMNIPTFLVGTVEAQSLKDLRTKREAAKLSKIAPDLEVLLADDDEEERQALAGGKTREEIKKERRARAAKLAVEEGDEAPKRTRVNGVILPSAEVLAEEKQSFIVQAASSTSDTVIQEKLALLGGRITHKSGSSGLLVIEATRSAIRQIAADANVGYVSPDRLVKPQGHLENATGTEQIRGLVSGTLMDGQGIGIAILDSGIDEVHKLVLPSLTHTGVVYRKDFTGQQITADMHGHGTHVASLANGDYAYKTGKYEGIAPGAKLINLRVLDSNGIGSASAVIAALDWCVTNKNLVVNGVSLNLRVINLSLGSIAKDSYVTDPLCLAARRAHNAGIVVVAAAGNDGKSLSGQKIYGGIHSPGIEPSVITVGASNTFGTDARSDDQVTTYSSRGPTRGYTVVNGVRKYDNLIKPDIVAPGNRLISSCSFSSWTNPQSLVNL